MEEIHHCDVVAQTDVFITVLQKSHYRASEVWTNLSEIRQFYQG